MLLWLRGMGLYSMGEWQRWSPVDFERRTREIMTKATQKALELEALEKAAAEAEVEYKLGLAKAQLTSDRKSVEDRKADALVRCEALFRDALVKGAVRDACREGMRVQREVLNAAQSIGALIRSEIGLAR